MIKPETHEPVPLENREFLASDRHKLADLMIKMKEQISSYSKG
jgi:hypothetical protein